MVYIHGGGFTNDLGYLYNGEPLSIVGDVIVINMNYRLSALGFLTTGMSSRCKEIGQDSWQPIQWLPRTDCLLLATIYFNMLHGRDATPVNVYNRVRLKVNGCRRKGLDIQDWETNMKTKMCWTLTSDSDSCHLTLHLNMVKNSFQKQSLFTTVYIRTCMRSLSSSAPHTMLDWTEYLIEVQLAKQMAGLLCRLWSLNTV